MSTPLSPTLTTIPLSPPPLKSTFSIYSLPAKDTSPPPKSVYAPRKAHRCGEYLAYLFGLVLCACVSAIGIGSIFTALGGLILGQFLHGYLSPSNTRLNVVPILVGGPILGLPAGVVAARTALSMTRTIIALVVMLGFTLASAFAFPVGVLVLQRYRTTPSGPTPVQALAASGTGGAACLAIVLLLYATYRLVFVASRLSSRFC